MPDPIRVGNQEEVPKSEKVLSSSGRSGLTKMFDDVWRLFGK